MLKGKTLSFLFVLIMNLNFLVTPEYSCSQPPEYGGKGIGLANTLGNVVGNVGGVKDREMALEWSGGTSLSEMFLQMIMLTKTFYLVTWKEYIWVISAEIRKLKAWRPECK